MTSRRMHSLRVLPLALQWKRDSRLYVQAFVQGRRGKPVWTIALVDTGALGTCISPMLARACHASFAHGKGSCGVVHGVGGRCRDRAAGVLIKVGEAECRCVVSVLYPWHRNAEIEMPYEMVLGQLWLADFGAVIDVGRRTIRVDARFTVERGKLAISK